jgi:hypothetical protein
MESLAKFLYIGVNSILFVAAVMICIHMMSATKAKEALLINDMGEKSSITMQEYYDKPEQEYVSVQGSDLYTDILTICDNYTATELKNGTVKVYVDNVRISGDTLAGARKRKPSSISNLRSIQTASQYRRTYTYSEDLSVTAIKYERV